MIKVALVLMRILLIISALFCFYIGFKLIIISFPAFLTPKRVKNIEGLFRFSPIERRLFVTKPLTTSQVAVLAVRVFMHIGGLSYFVITEQLRHIVSRVSRLKSQVESLIDNGNYTHCRGVLYETKLFLQNIAYQPFEEFDYSFYSRKLDDIENNFKEGINLVDRIEAECKELSLIIQDLVTKEDPEIAGAANSLQESFLSIIEDLQSANITNLSQLNKILHTLNSLSQIAKELEAESFKSRDLDIGTFDWVDYYSILEIKPTATQEEVKQAYRRKIMQYHPDRKLSEIGKISDPDIKEEMERIFNQRTNLVNKAYEILKDPETRSKYDEEYKHQKGGIADGVSN